MIHFISDTHFGHANIIKFSYRPFKSVEEMDQALIDNWNRCVKPTDTIYHLGDFSFAPFARIAEILRQLNGRKHFIFGNHDKEIRKHRHGGLLDDRYFSSIQDYLEISSPGGTKIVLFHYGQRVWNKSHYGSIHLYGHSHGSLPPLGKSVDVGVDCKEITPEYRPVSMDEVLAYMDKRQFEATDRHGRMDG